MKVIFLIFPLTLQRCPSKLLKNCDFCLECLESGEGTKNEYKICGSRKTRKLCSYIHRNVGCCKIPFSNPNQDYPINKDDPFESICKLEQIKSILNFGLLLDIKINKVLFNGNKIRFVSSLIGTHAKTDCIGV